MQSEWEINPMNNLHSTVWLFLWPMDCLGYLSFSITEADCGALHHWWLGCSHVSALIQIGPTCIVLRKHHSTWQRSLTSTLSQTHHLFGFNILSLAYSAHRPHYLYSAHLSIQVFFLRSKRWISLRSTHMCGLHKIYIFVYSHHKQQTITTTIIRLI